MPEGQETEPAAQADDATSSPARADERTHRDGVRRQREHIEEMTGQDPLSSLDD